jgi:hypothetical protein
MEEDLTSIKAKIIKINKLLQSQPVCNDSEYKKKLVGELDKLFYKYYKALIAQMTNMSGNGDGI